MLSSSHCQQVKSLPLCERVIRSNEDDGIAQPLAVRPTAYGTYTPEQMDRALNAVLQRGMSVRDAAEMYGVPKSTLGDRKVGEFCQELQLGP